MSVISKLKTWIDNRTRAYNLTYTEQDPIKFRPGDSVVIFQACIAWKWGSTDDYAWVDRHNEPQLVIFVGIKNDPELVTPEIGVLLNLENIKGIYVFPQSALVLI